MRTKTTSNKTNARGRKKTPPQEAQTPQEITFYLDRESYYIEMRKYSLLLEYAKEIKGAFAEIGIPLTNRLLIGFMQVEEKRTEPTKEIQFNDATENTAPTIYALRKSATPQAESELSKYIGEVCASYPISLRNKYVSEMEAQADKLRADCEALRKKWESGNVAFNGLNFDAVEYNETTQEITLNADFVKDVEARNTIKAETEEVRQNYGLLCEVCALLNRIKKTANAPFDLLDAIDINATSLDYEPKRNYNLNYVL